MSNPIRQMTIRLRYDQMYGLLAEALEQVIEREYRAEYFEIHDVSVEELEENTPGIYEISFEIKKENDDESV